MNEGDYRLDNRVFDHVISIEMVSHVGPRGLVPYVKNVRKRIKKGGRYLHQTIMTPHTKTPLDSEIGVAFHKKYIWPGFHWFTVGEHIKALEENGFEVVKAVSLTRHYHKTMGAWAERMMANMDVLEKNLDKTTLRAWQIYLPSSAGSFGSHNNHVYRIYCEAV